MFQFIKLDKKDVRTMFILSIFDEFEEMFAHRSYNTTL